MIAFDSKYCLNPFEFRASLERLKLSAITHAFGS